VFVVAQERAVRVGRERRLAGSGQPEKHRDVVPIAHVRRAMHRHDLLGRQHVVQIGEDRLLHLARIGCAADEHDAAAEIAGDHGLRPASVARRVRLERGQVDDREARRVAPQFPPIRPDQQVADEQGVPSVFGEHPGAHAIIRVGAAVEVLREEVHALRVGEEIGEEGLELLRRHGAVVLPPDRLLGVGVAHDELILGRTAGMHTRVGEEGAAVRELGLAAAERVFVQGRRLQVPEHAFEVAEAKGFGALRTVEDADIFHDLLLLVAVRCRGDRP
jgi:hypothetical protein